MSGAAGSARGLVAPLLLLWLFGICLRITVLAIPPVIPLMHQSFTLSQATIGALTSLPVLLFSFAAIPGSLLVARFGPAHVLTAGILVTAVAGAMRALSPDIGILFATTFLMGLGIAIMQPALPAVVRDWVPQRIALGTAVYSNALLVGEAISASLTIPVVLPWVGASWRWSLVVWSVPVLAIGLLAAWVTWRRADTHPSPPGGRRWWPDWRDPLTWKLGLIAGFASSLYFATNAFLPDYLKSRGRPDLLAAALSALNWVQIPASVLMLVFADRLTLRRWPFITLGLLAILSLLGMLYMSEEWIIAWAGILGFCNAFMLILTLALPPQIGQAQDVHRLSAAMLAIGYLCAFVLPIIGGIAWDSTGSARAAFAPLVIFAFLAVVLAATLDFTKHRRLAQPP
jgi:CP family cyanate transporter-like MFS transporter